VRQNNGFKFVIYAPCERHWDVDPNIKCGTFCVPCGNACYNSPMGH